MEIVQASLRDGSNVTVHSVHSNALRAAILGFSVNFVHKKHLAERYQ